MSKCSDSPCVAVLIPAKDAAATIGRAVASALAQPQAAEVAVIDDGSRDGTAEAALSQDDGSGRLSVIRQANAGPSAAVNRGQDATTSPWFCVLDADDYFLPGRLRGIFEACDTDWDLAADRPVIASEAAPEGPQRPWGGRIPPDGRLEFATFVAGNISRVLRPRTELGFLQPVFRRAFLERHGLRHDERVRLGEDYLLYAQALACGARFRVAPTARYVIVERASSLSHKHRIADLSALLAADLQLSDHPGLSAAERRLVLRHASQIRARLRHREALAAKADGDIAQALRLVFSDPGVAQHVLSRTVADKLRALGARRRSVAADVPDRRFQPALDGWEPSQAD